MLKIIGNKIEPWQLIGAENLTFSFSPRFKPKYKILYLYTQNKMMFDEERESLKAEWEELSTKLEDQFGKKPDLNGVLFLVGIQELGKGVKNFSKEEKQDLMHIAICKVLSFSGFYELEGLDGEGWPHWKPTKKLPFLDLLSQEKMLKAHVIEYFKQEVFS